MLLISNNVDALGVPYPKNAIIRINTAWVNTKDALISELNRLANYPIYLDYPIGRSKPPLPQMRWEDILEVAFIYKNIRYVAWSNAQDPVELENARKELPNEVMLVPKIETLIGVLNLDQIVEASQTKVIMIDKEDLATSSKCPKIYQHFLDHCRKKASELGVEAIELKGVIFA